MLAPALNWPLHFGCGLPPVGEMHVWAFALDTLPEGIAECAAVLSNDELQRAEQFRMEHLRRRYIVAHGSLRTILGRSLNRPPETLEFTFSARGKPRLNEGEVEFNLAHSDELGVLAVARGTIVGVDVERIRPMPDGLDIARRFFSAREVAAFEPIPESERDEAFFNLWTRKEAWLKATGDGITESLSKVEFTFRRGEVAHVLAIDGDDRAAGEWTIIALNPASGFTGALAVPMPKVTVNCWQFEPCAQGARRIR
jgi:4'-phosphopantetheinyl transferase